MVRIVYFVGPDSASGSSLALASELAAAITTPSMPATVLTASAALAAEEASGSVNGIAIGALREKGQSMPPQLAVDAVAEQARRCGDHATVVVVGFPSTVAEASIIRSAGGSGLRHPSTRVVGLVATRGDDEKVQAILDVLLNEDGTPATRSTRRRAISPIFGRLLVLHDARMDLDSAAALWERHGPSLRAVIHGPKRYFFVPRIASTAYAYWSDLSLPTKIVLGAVLSFAAFIAGVNIHSWWWHRNRRLRLLRRLKEQQMLNNSRYRAPLHSKFCVENKGAPVDEVPNVADLQAEIRNTFDPKARR